MRRITLLGLVLATVASVPAQVTDSTEPSAQARPEYSDLQLLETWGWLLAQRFNLRNLETTELELEAINRGMEAFIKGEEPPTDLQFSVGQMQAYFTQRETRVREEQIAENTAAEQAFFDSLFGKSGIQSLGSGLHFEILEEGEGPEPDETDVVEVHYRGTFIDGEVFDSSYAKGRPARFRLNGVIPGWTQGLQLIGEGGKIKLYVPAELGYGEMGSEGVPPASTLIFEVELLKVLGDVELPSAAGNAAGQ